MICAEFEIPTAWSPREDEPSASALGMLSHRRIVLVPCFKRGPLGRAQQRSAVAHSQRRSPHLAGVLQELQDNDALYIADETAFEHALELVRWAMCGAFCSV
jgi:hypothetical protein